MKIRGRVVRKYGGSINTDYVISADLLQESWDNEFFAKHAFEKYDPEFVKLCSRGRNNILVAGPNFGCGSSREHAVHAIKHNNVVCIIAPTYPDIFYRNSINNSLPVFKAETGDMAEGDELEVDTGKGTVLNLRTGETTVLANSREDLKSMEGADRLSMVKERLRQRLAAGGERS